jgi:hypothetical protein
VLVDEVVLAAQALASAVIEWCGVADQPQEAS